MGFFVLTNLYFYILKISGFYAWSGNNGVKSLILTMLTLILTPGVEIMGSKFIILPLS